MKKLGFLSMSALLMCACSSSEMNELDPSNQESALLSISTSVLTQDTKAGMTKTVGTGDAAVDGVDKGPVMGTALAKGSQIGVCVYGNADASADYPQISGGNTNRLWTYGENWTTTTPFYLQEKLGYVFAYFPYNADATSMTAIPVTPGYTDYLYGKDATAVHRNKTGAAITLKHALSLISFTFVKADNYPSDAILNSITVKNHTTNATMSIVDGALTAGNGVLDLTIKDFQSNAYTDTIAADTKLPFVKDKTVLGSVADVNTAPRFHALVFPTTDIPTATGESDLHASITINSVEYKIPLTVKNIVGVTDGKPTTATWLAGKSYTYNLTLTPKALEVTSVTVTQWTEGGSSDVEL